ncbi:hypothetical protein [Cystobacter ferrugineus]|uniref:hypothetical protein n=1 Tax=Cystobacter ferrugineus TaxID=83449 RepID=UPI0011611807|nr:hypothetical protein [Cystobacter ferrugineus]
MKTLSRDDLLAIIRNYYDSSSEFLYTSETSPATKRLHALWTQWLENMGPWNAFLNELESELPTFVVGDTLSSSDGGPRCLVYPPKESRVPGANWVVVGCISLLAPVYMVYGVECDYADGGLRNEKASFAQPPSNMALPAQIVARKIETTFGFSAVSCELAETPVPLFVGGREPSEVTLFHALFTSDPSVIP